MSDASIKVFYVKENNLYIRWGSSRSILKQNDGLGLNGGALLTNGAFGLKEGSYSEDELKAKNLWYVDDYMGRPLIDWTGDDTDCIINLNVDSGIITYQDI